MGQAVPQSNRISMKCQRTAGTAAVLVHLVALVCFAAATPVSADGEGDSGNRESISTADHSTFDTLQRDFESGPDVTRACLTCHTEAGHQVRQSIHWTWDYRHPDTGQQLGKRHVLNSFCTNLRTNQPRCTSCHTGYGWNDASFDFSDDSRVDCLVCHDTTGTYDKAPRQAGRVLKNETTIHGDSLTPPDLGAVARNIGQPDIATCGSCHFNGGGGDGSKHGDLDSSLIDAPYSLDVHMSPQGGDMTCQDCHVSTGHQLAGGRYDMTARDREGTGKPGKRRRAATCESCHGVDVHDDGSYVARTLNQHNDRVACQTCHIPEIARGGVQTKIWWDWSKAGRLAEDGSSIHEKNASGRTSYWTRWGEIEWREDYVPSYAWFDGNVRYTRPTDEIDPESVVPINRLTGSADNPDARVWPFKVMRGKQPYDSARKRLVLMHLFGKDDTAYWKNLDWAPAIQAAMDEKGLPFSGEIGFVETRMYWPITHMVAPAEQAVSCEACHSRDSRLVGLTDFYMPGRDAPAWLDRIGALALLATLLGVLGHAALRIFFHYRRARQ